MMLSTLLAVKCTFTQFASSQSLLDCGQTLLCRYPGGLKERAAKDQHEKDPVKVLYNAVYGMLPKNKLRKVGP